MPCRIMMMYGITILCRITIYSMMYQDGTHSRSILLIASGGTQLHARFTSTHSNSTHSSHQIHSSTPPGTGNTSSDSMYFNSGHSTVPSHQFQLAFHTAPVCIPKIRIA